MCNNTNFEESTGNEDDDDDDNNETSSLTQLSLIQLNAVKSPEPITFTSDDDDEECLSTKIVC